jgi:hypothetical protein
MATEAMNVLRIFETIILRKIYRPINQGEC